MYSENDIQIDEDSITEKIIDTKVDKISNKKSKIKYVMLKNKKYEVLEETKPSVLIEVDIINSKGKQDKFKQWYSKSAVRFI